MQTGNSDRQKYAADKPKECAYCYFWRGKRKDCGRRECFYLISEKKQGQEDLSEKDHGQPLGEKDSCGGCPYGKHSPCIGYCIKKILLEMNRKKRAAGKEGKTNAG